MHKPKPYFRPRGSKTIPCLSAHTCVAYERECRHSSWNWLACVSVGFVDTRWKWRRRSWIFLLPVPLAASPLVFVTPPLKPYIKPPAAKAKTAWLHWRFMTLSIAFRRRENLLPGPYGSFAFSRERERLVAKQQIIQIDRQWKISNFHIKIITKLISLYFNYY